MNLASEIVRVCLALKTTRSGDEKNLRITSRLLMERRLCEIPGAVKVDILPGTGRSRVSLRLVYAPPADEMPVVPDGLVVGGRVIIYADVVPTFSGMELQLATSTWSTYDWSRLSHYLLKFLSENWDPGA